MPTERLSMRRIRQLLALHFGAGASTRAIGRELGIAPSTVREYLARATAAGIGWPLAADVTDESLGGAAVRQCRGAHRRAVSRRARLGSAGAGAQASRRQPADFVGGISGGPPGRLRLQPVLPAVPRVRAAAVADHAPAARRRAQGVRRLLRQAGADCRSAHRRSAHGRDLRGGARRLQLHLRRGDVDADVAGLDRRPCAHVPLLWRSAATAGSRQPQERHQQGLVLRPRGEPQLRGDGGALRRGRSASPAEAPARQGCRRGRGQIRAVVHPRPAAQRHVLLPGGVQRRHRRRRGADERPRDAPPWRQPPPVVRGDRAARHAAAARRTISSMPSGISPASASTTTSRSRAFSTRCRMP